MASILTSTRCWGRRTLPILTLLFIVVFQSKAETTDVLTPATVEPSSTSTPNHKYTIKTINSGSYWGGRTRWIETMSSQTINPWESTIRTL